jgi:hypothetical protein
MFRPCDAIWHIFSLADGCILQDSPDDEFEPPQAGIKLLRVGCAYRRRTTVVLQQPLLLRSSPVYLCKQLLSSDSLHGKPLQLLDGNELALQPLAPYSGSCHARGQCHHHHQITKLSHSINGGSVYLFASLLELLNG